MPTFQFGSVHEWFEEFLKRQSEAELYQLAVQLANEIDADRLQDIFQNEMERDGYFLDLDELESEA
jgi:hypothetical protein